jgi:AbrB family looped-hinge helix DNA binding protein
MEGKKMDHGSTLSPKYQVSIPKALRKQLDWRPGQKLAFIPKGKGVLMIPVPDREALVGIARGANLDNYRDRNDRV